LFGAIAFLSYGFFWISFTLLVILPKAGFAPATSADGLAWYMFIWGIFTTGMFVATLKKASWGLVILFFTVVLLFMLLASHFWTLSENLLKAAGIEGAICGLIAVYLAIAELLNETYGKTVLPVGARAVKK
jgi:hypothetical protein